MSVPLRRERRKEPLGRSITSALERYLGDMKGHEVNDLFYVVMNEVEPAMLDVVMKYTEGNQSHAADILGISRSTLRKKLKLYES